MQFKTVAELVYYAEKQKRQLDELQSAIATLRNGDRDMVNASKDDRYPVKMLVDLFATEKDYLDRLMCQEIEVRA